MRNLKMAGVLMLALTLAGTGVATAQMGMGRSPQFQGVWNPVVGSGAAYQVESKGERGLNKSQIEIAIVDKESVDGKTAYWLEYAMQDPRSGGTIYLKHLIALTGKDTIVQRMIMQAPGMPQPMEMSMEMAAMRGSPAKQATDFRDKAERVGSESVTTPAGTFQCEHWRIKDGSADVWVSDKISPWGLVKMTGKDANMTLVRLITNAKTHITGTPVKFDPTEMIRQQKRLPQ